MSTIEVKTADLIGPALDWATFCAIYTGIEPTIHVIEEATIERKPFIKPITFPRTVHLSYSGAYGVTVPWHPSTDWECGGPLIDKHRFEFEWVGSDWHGEPLEFFTACGCDMPADATSAGPTHLIAACRAIVRAKLGDTVQIPAELA